MLNRWFSYVLLVACLIVSPGAYGENFLPLILEKNDRILVLAPHPDDEVLGTAGVLQQAVDLKIPIKVVFLTHGDSNSWSFLLYRKHPVVLPNANKKMGLVRREEAEDAARILGIDVNDLIFLGYPDFGTLNIWNAHWDDRPALRALLTQAQRVPYRGAFRPGAPYKGEEIVADLRTILKDFKPTKIFVSHPADHNGDHLAFYLFLRIALWDEQIADDVNIYPYLIHYLSWPKPKGLQTKKDLLPPDALKNTVTWYQYRLTPKQIDLKKTALLAHQTQFKSSPKYLLSFVRQNEIFGDFSYKKIHLNEDYTVFRAQRNITKRVDLPQEYNAHERSNFVGVDWKFLRWESDDLIVSIQLSKPLAQDVEASIFIFGYNPQVPFKTMPKINVRLGVLSYNVYDQQKRLEHGSITVKRTNTDITIKVPFKLLGNPDRILTSARTYLGNVPLDSASWVTVGLE